MEILPFIDGRVLDATSSPFPSRLICVENKSAPVFSAESHVYGFVLNGRTHISRNSLNTITLNEGMYFSGPMPMEIKCDGRAVLWERLNYAGLFSVGGPVEPQGRLKYIDGCTTTILVPPPKVLEPVLNLLCFPPHTKQTMHFHPTPRLGVVFSGSGECVRPSKEPIQLSVGSIFLLEENLHHCFHTRGEPLHLIAFHPDSDTGPTDENHPMLNRTYRIS